MPSERGVRGLEPPGAGDAAPPETREGWNVPLPEHLPQRTPWPVAAALGVVLIFWGVVTSYLVFGVGVVLLGLSVVGWVKELRREGRGGAADE